VDREVERIKDEAAERLREAFYTDGLLSQFRRTAGEGFREAFDVVFQDAMILTEPGKAEQVPSSTHPKARARLQAAERERERLRIELQEAHRSLSKLTNDPDFHEDIREKWSSIAFWRSKAEAAEAALATAEQRAERAERQARVKEDARAAVFKSWREAEAQLDQAREALERIASGKLPMKDAQAHDWISEAKNLAREALASPPEGEKDG
jgi:chromosome segregation ATPase